MKKLISRDFLFILLLILISLIPFRAYLLEGKIPYPGNLLVSFFSPWKFEKFAGWEQGIPNKPMGFDNLRFFYPLKKQILSILNEKSLPFWNFNVFSGNVLLSNSQTAVFYPLNFLYLIFPFNTAWSLLILLLPVLSCIFSYLFLRSLSLEKLPSFFGAFSFSFSGLMAVWMEENPAISHTFLWLPFILYSLNKFFDYNKLHFLFLGILAFSFSILAGFIQAFIYIWFLCLFFTLYKLKISGKYSLLEHKVSSLLILFSPLLLTSFFLLPSFEAYWQSPRIVSSSFYLKKEYLIPFTRLMTMVVPDIFGNPGSYNYFGGGVFYDRIIYFGLIPLVFSIYALFVKDRYLNFFKVSFLISFFLLIKSPVTVFLFSKLPFFSSVSPSRIFIISCFSLAVLSAYGFKSFFKKPMFSSLNKILILFGFLFLEAIIFIILLSLHLDVSPFWRIFINKIFDRFYLMEIIAKQGYLQIAIRNIVIPLFLTIIVFSILYFYQTKLKYQKTIQLIILVILILHQFYFLNKSLYFSEKGFEYPVTKAITYLIENSHGFGIVGVGDAHIFPNALAGLDLASPEGMDPIFSRRYGGFIYYLNNKKFSDDTPRIEAKINIDSIKDINDPENFKIYSYLGIRYFLVPKQLFNGDEINSSLKKVWENENLSIFENHEAFPLCWLISEANVVKDGQKILEILFSRNFDFKQQIILEEQNDQITNTNLNRSVDKITSIRTAPNKIMVNTQLNNSSYLICRDNYFPGWKAIVDGRKTSIQRANYTFKTLWLPAGTREINMYYKPLSWKYGISLSLLSVIIILAYFIIIILKNRKKS